MTGSLYRDYCGLLLALLLVQPSQVQLNHSIFSALCFLINYKKYFLQK